MQNKQSPDFYRVFQLATRVARVEERNGGDSFGFDCKNRDGSIAWLFELDYRGWNRSDREVADRADEGHSDV